jgi:catechol 2,3-dioxygenase
MIELKRIGHVLLRVTDVERAKLFYTKVLGFQFREQDPDHGGVFLGLQEYGHTIDLMPLEKPGPLRTDNMPGVQHIAFQVDSEQALRDSYFELKDRGVEILRIMDHVSQKSIYFRDPDGNMLEIYYELPDALEYFRRGRGDQDKQITFER